VSNDAFDLVVIGSGPGGYVAAIRAAQLGLRVACIEKYPTLGGTCLNVGCIPSKALLDSSEHFEYAGHGLAAHGVRVQGVTLDLAAMQARKDQVVKDLTRGVEGLFRKHKIERFTGTGRIVSAREVEVAGEGPARRLTAGRILIATGSKPASLPGIAYDGRRIVHSTDALTLSQVPARLLVVGAGAIGLELGSVWRRLGSQVTVLEYLDRIVPGTDAGSAKLLQRSLERQGMKFRFGVSARSASVQGDQVRVEVATAGGETGTETADVLLVAVGRRPFTDGLGARELGVRFDERGRIEVDAHYQTSVPGVYAIGDVIAGPMLAHKAEEEGVACVERMAGVAGHVNYAAIPNVVYTWPELAGVGWSEEDARERGVSVKVGTFPFLANGRAKAMGEKDGQVKIVADAATDRVLGAHIVGPHASTLIAELVVAMELGASAEDLARTVHAHPTLPEAVKEAALAVGGRALHI
jgi:dihydrolipoamide dehydrogenase